jgi:hypothetical protein
MPEDTPNSDGSDGSTALPNRERQRARKMWIVGGASALILLAVVVLVVGPLPVWLARGNYAVITTVNGRAHTDPGTADRIQAVNAARSSLITLLVGTLTGLGLIGGLLATIRNLRLTRESIGVAQRNLELTATRDREAQALALQGHVTDRYSRAVEQLGDSKSLHVRLDERFQGVSDRRRSGIA